MRYIAFFLGVTLWAAISLAEPAAAQLTQNTAPQPTAAATMPPEIFTLFTKDGVQLTLTHFPSGAQKGTQAAKQVAPVVLLHDYKDTRAIYNSLALRLQAAVDPGTGHPYFDVVSVDLRAHGESTKQAAPNGGVQELDAAKLNVGGFQAMAGFDMETVRSWLVAKNEDAALNLNKLCIVGAGMGASVAVNWAARDWSIPPLATGKQGQDVKALVLISPQWSYRGLQLQAPLQVVPFKQNVAWLLIYGADDPEAKADSRRIYEQLMRFHPEQNVPGANGLSSLGWPTKLQGGKLLTQVGQGVDDQISQFLITQVAVREYPWISHHAQ